MQFQKYYIIPSLFSLMIISSYLLWAWDLSNPPLRYPPCQRYRLELKDSAEFVKKYLGICQSASSYSTFHEPFHGKYKTIDNWIEASGGGYVCLEGKKFSFSIGVDNGCLDLVLWNIVPPYEVYGFKYREIEKRVNDGSELSLWENINVQKTFESEVLDKICPYEKETMQGVRMWYITFFFHYQLLFLLVGIVLFLLPAMCRIIKQHRLTLRIKKSYIIPILLLFIVVSSYILCLSDYHNRPLRYPPCQRYILELKDNTEFVKRYQKVCQSGSSTPSNYAPCHSEHRAVKKWEGRSDYGEICIDGLKFCFYMDESNSCLYLILWDTVESHVDGGLNNKETAKVFNDGSRITLCENLRLQNAFEHEVLDKICSYKKETLQGLRMWYVTFFWHNHLWFLLASLIIFLLPTVYKRLKSHILH